MALTIQRWNWIQRTAQHAPADWLGALFLAHVHFADDGAEVFEDATAADFHGGGHFAELDGEIAVEDAEFADLFKGRELFVDAGDGFADAIDHRGGGGDGRFG